ncbi:MAG: Rieske (2Fe-2S) protein [Polyangiaceae bacterium]
MSERDEGSPKTGRRRVLTLVSQAAMAAGLVASYGTCGYVGFRYVSPRPSRKARLFVADLASFAVGRALDFVLPGGARVAIARRSETGGADDFVALSSTCPHLGCQVHWEGEAERFFCPCHNGTFDAGGQPTGGPPLADGTPLVRYPLAVEAGLLYLEVDEEALS